jgi:hypothetical protein
MSTLFRTGCVMCAYFHFSRERKISAGKYVEFIYPRINKLNILWKSYDSIFCWPKSTSKSNKLPESESKILNYEFINLILTEQAYRRAKILLLCDKSARKTAQQKYLEIYLDSRHTKRCSKLKDYYYLISTCKMKNIFKSCVYVNSNTKARNQAKWEICCFFIIVLL